MRALYAIVLGAAVLVLLVAIAASSDGFAVRWRIAVAASVGFGMAGLSSSFAGWGEVATILSAVIGAGGMALAARWVG